MSSRIVWRMSSTWTTVCSCLKYNKKQSGAQARPQHHSYKDNNFFSLASTFSRDRAYLFMVQPQSSAELRSGVMERNTKFVLCKKYLSIHIITKWLKLQPWVIHGETPLLAIHVKRVSSDLWISLGARTVTDGGSIARGELNSLGDRKIHLMRLICLRIIDI